MRTLRILILLIFTYVSTNGQTPIELSKKSVINYCKKHYTLYKPSEWKDFGKEPYVFEDFTIDLQLDKILNKNIELKDTINLKKVNKYIKNHKVSVKDDGSLLGYIDSIILKKINDKLCYFIPINFYGSTIDTIIFYNKSPNNNSTFLNYDLDNNAKVYLFDPIRETYTKQVYSILHTYEAITKGGYKKYFTSIFYINMKTYEIIKEDEM